MLVLSRNRGERILIGDHIAITIVRIGPNSVRVGIDAPPELNIVREEIAADCIASSTAHHLTVEPAA